MLSSISERKSVVPSPSSPCSLRWAKRICSARTKCRASKPCSTHFASFDCGEFRSTRNWAESKVEAVKWPRLSEQARNRLASLLRFIVLIPMVGLGIPICSYTHRVWTDYWLSKDAKQAAAVILQAHPKRVFDYKYTVDGKDYSGTSWRDWEDEKIHALKVGEQTAVLFSSSHPWLSSMQTSRASWAGLP